MLDVYNKALDLYEKAAELPPTDLASRHDHRAGPFPDGFHPRGHEQGLCDGRGTCPLLTWPRRRHITAMPSRGSSDCWRNRRGRRSPPAVCRCAGGMGARLVPGDDETSRSGRAAVPPSVRDETGTGARPSGQVVDRLGGTAQAGPALPIRWRATSRLEAATEEAEGRPRRPGGHLRNLAGRPMTPEGRHDLATPLGQYGTQLTAQNRRRDGAEILRLAIVLDPETPTR